MSDHHFWLSEAQFARLKPLLPNKPRGVPRVDDRRVISRIIHVIRGGLMWRDAPDHVNDTVMIDRAHLKARRTAAGLLKKGLFPAVSDGPKAA
jgi:putative transposase